MPEEPKGRVGGVALADGTTVDGEVIVIGVAEQQAAFVARQWLGEDEPYATVPYFFSDLADRVSLEPVTGPRLRRVQIEGSLDDDAFAVWLLQGDTPLGYASSNGACDLDRGRAVLKAGGPVPSA